MNEQEYRTALDAALKAAGQSDGQWNQRFVNALHNRALVLVPIEEVDLRGSYYVQAPYPVKDEPPMWPPSAIMPL